MPKRKANNAQLADKQGKRAKQGDSGAKVQDNRQGWLSDECKTDIKKENQRMQDAYGTIFPDDFFRLWDFCKQIDEQNPKMVFREFGGLVLSGPYDFLSGNGNTEETTQYHLHSRHYYDPPEFMTVLEVADLQNGDGFHIGYWRDDPGSLPSLVASNRSLTNGHFSICGDNLFAAIYIYLQSMKKEKRLLNAIKDFTNKLKTAAHSLHLTLDAVTSGIKTRKKSQVVSAAFHQVGICVPVSDDDVGYRPLTLTDGQLRKLLDRISKAQDDDAREAGFDELYEMVTLIQFANDESDYGMGLEFGLDLFTYGGEVFHKTILNTLPLAYELLGRHLYADITRAHLEQRTSKPRRIFSE